MWLTLITINKIHRFPTKVKLLGSFILKVSHLFVASQICKKNLHLMYTGLDPQQGLSENGNTPTRAFHIENFITISLYCPGILFSNIQEMSKEVLLH